VVWALQGLSLQVRAGQVRGLVGPNGAGKTSTLRALAGIIRVDVGEVRVCGRPAGPEHPETRRLVGVVPETPQLYEDLTALENLHFFARAHGLRPSKGHLGEALDRQGVAPLADRVVATLSKGQKQRVSLACGLIHEPAVVLLDEPFSGLDVESREALREAIRSLAQDEKTVLVSSHDLSDVDALCPTVSVVVSGRVVADGPTGEVKDVLGGLLHLPGAWGGARVRVRRRHSSPPGRSRDRVPAPDHAAEPGTSPCLGRGGLTIHAGTRPGN
jgi:ABC-2 type transport system ATP-binding protein